MPSASSAATRPACCERISSRSGGSLDSQYQPPSGSTSAWARSSQHSGPHPLELVAGAAHEHAPEDADLVMAPHSRPQPSSCCPGDSNAGSASAGHSDTP